MIKKGKMIITGRCGGGGGGQKLLFVVPMKKKSFFLERRLRRSESQRLERVKGPGRGHEHRSAEGDPHDDRAGVAERLGLDKAAERGGQRPPRRRRLFLPAAVPGRRDDQAVGEGLRRVDLLPVVAEVLGRDEVAEEGGLGVLVGGGVRVGGGARA